MGYLIQEDPDNNVEIWLNAQTSNKSIKIQCSGTGKIILTPGSGGVEVTSGGISVTGGITGSLTGNVTGNVSGSSGSCTGNAATVTNGVYTTGDQIINGTKMFTTTISGSVNGNAATVTNGVYTSGNQTIGGTKTFSSTISGSITGNAGTVTNGVYTSGTYSDPSWITSLAASKLSGSVSDSVHGNRSGGSLHSEVGPALAGFMPASDHTKLAGIASGATVGATWSVNISGQPSTFPPSSHSHTAATIDSGTTTAGKKLTANGDGSCSWT
jgi:hypothetical protein